MNDPPAQSIRPMQKAAPMAKTLAILGDSLRQLIGISRDAVQVYPPRDLKRLQSA